MSGVTAESPLVMSGFILCSVNTNLSFMFQILMNAAPFLGSVMGVNVQIQSAVTFANVLLVFTLLPTVQDA